MIASLRPLLRGAGAFAAKALLLVPGLLVLAAGCSPAPPPAKDKTVKVDVAVPTPDMVQDHQDFTGRLDAFRTVDVKPRASGYIKKAPFKEGDYVKEGDILYTIDKRLYTADLQQAEANLKLAIADTALQESNTTRARQLILSRAMGKEEYDLVLANREKAKMTVLSLEAARDRAKVNLGYTDVIAPLSGRISRRLVDPGNLVKADETTLTTIVSDDEVYAYFDVDERTYLDLVGEKFSARSRERVSALKLPVLMRLANEDDYLIHTAIPTLAGLLPISVPARPGIVDFIDNRLNGNTGTIRFRGVFPNKRGTLKSGLFVRIRLPIHKPYQSLLIPDEALQSDQGRKYVYVVDSNDKVEYRAVTIGEAILKHGKAMRVVKNGLQPGERVITSNMQRVRPKDKVIVKNNPAVKAGDLPSATKPR